MVIADIVGRTLSIFFFHIYTVMIVFSNDYFMKRYYVSTPPCNSLMNIYVKISLS
jgi:hypothetical protein